MTPKQLVEGLDHLVSLPDVCVKVNRLVDAPNYSAAALGEVIAQDADLSSRLLRLVNSSFFSYQSKIDTISRAVAMVGTNELRNLVLATSAARIFTGIPADLVDMTEFWRHSVLTGVVAKELAQRCNVLHSERLFVMGILHDIGRLVIYLNLPEQSRDILLITGGDDMLLPDAERDVLGFTHMQVGAELLDAWRLPQGMRTVVANHHEPERTEDYLLETVLVHLAIAVANGEMLGQSVEEVCDNITCSVWKLSGLAQSDVSEIMEGTADRLSELTNLILSPPASSHRS